MTEGNVDPVVSSMEQRDLNSIPGTPEDVSSSNGGSLWKFFALWNWIWHFLSQINLVVFVLVLRGLERWDDLSIFIFSSRELYYVSSYFPVENNFTIFIIFSSSSYRFFYHIFHLSLSSYFPVEGPCSSRQGGSGSSSGQNSGCNSGEEEEQWQLPKPNLIQGGLSMIPVPFDFLGVMLTFYFQL